MADNRGDARALMDAEEINGVRVVITKVEFVVRDEHGDVPGPLLGRFEGFMVDNRGDARALMEAEEINGVRVVITKEFVVRGPGPLLGRFEGVIVGDRS